MRAFAFVRCRTQRTPLHGQGTPTKSLVACKSHGRTKQPKRSHPFPGGGVIFCKDRTVRRFEGNPEVFAVLNACAQNGEQKTTPTAPTPLGSRFWVGSGFEPSHGTAKKTYYFSSFGRKSLPISSSREMP